MIDFAGAEGHNCGVQHESAKFSIRPKRSRIVCFAGILLTIILF
ncbi:hypothetical protein NEIELOOT_02141 [Neisseria elongata subsp. glycolytica ATCC 29315]|uniref:Uncharacterized protein n=1 Tax=Neisseria elongata subsp. glycolytica ATCC 29315 TaxID=546263 RepID=D4DSU4_NEIEG|nr:hypothetical protein NEIELOOT_02141 [Neisseria elongata subsp. glycolytica ATCC 29315]